MSAVVVVGAGLAGLSAACHLAGRGHRVTVIERQPGPGGRGIRVAQDGYRFDTGPTVLTMPGLVAGCLRAAGADPGGLLPMRRLDPAYRACFADGSHILVHPGVEAMRQEILDACGRADADAFVDFAGWLHRLYRVEMPHFIDTNMGGPAGLLAHPGALARLAALGGFRRLGPVIRARFRDPRLHRLFSFQALYAGLSPEKALALYAIITYMDCIEGVWWPEGGMAAVPRALAAAACGAGADVRYDTCVSALVTDRRGVLAGVELASGGRLVADAVVVTADLPVAYRRLLPDLRAPRAARSGRYSPSALVWHVGATGAPPADAAHHNIHFGSDWAGAFEALIDRRELMPDPSRLVSIPTVSEPGQAPAGGSVLYVLEPVPNLTSAVDWGHERVLARARLLSFLADHGYPTNIITERLVTPADWQEQGLQQGTPFALAHTFTQSGPFRPPNIERRVPGVFFAGSGTVPGVGVPMVLISGRLAAQRVNAYLPAPPCRPQRGEATGGAGR